MSKTMVANILAVEDDAAIGVVIKDTLGDAGYSCEVLPDGLSGLKRALDGTFDLLLLDVNLPHVSGLDICQQVKQRFPSIPIILLTARVTEADVVTGLEVGADDYIPKPFRPRELLARVRARLREHTRQIVAEAAGERIPANPGGFLDIGELSIDFDKMRVMRRGDILDLSAREFELVALLANNPGRPFTRDQLLETIWNFQADGYDPNVSVFVSRLRKKIEDDPDAPKYILTVRGIGYRFAEPHEVP